MTEDLVLCWQNLSVFVTERKKHFFTSDKVNRVKLISNASGIIKSGTLSAIIGPSGAGKTTLLAAISQRFEGQVQGSLHLNGCPVDRSLMTRMSGFVPQEDLAIQVLTVREHLHFMASLKLDRRVSELQKSRIISSLIQDLGLMNCTFTRLSSISGGERKRVSLAVQLLTDPPILICDEPTSGLDSSTAASVITLLRDLSTKGKIVLCSIHQPASGVFEMFDTLTLLVPGGKVAYFGDLNETKDYFATLGLLCPPSYNTAEFVVRQLNTMPDKLAESYVNSKDYINLHRNIDGFYISVQKKQLIFGMEEKFLKFYSVQQPTVRTQMKWLVWRSGVELYRNWTKILLRLFMYIVSGLLISSPFIGIKLNQEGIQNVQGLNYSVVTETIFTQAYAVLHTFPGEIPILLREINNGVYKPEPYYLSKVFIWVIRSFIEALLFCTIIYSVVGSNESTVGFSVFALPIIVCGISSTAYGTCISAMFESLNMATLLTVPVDFISYVLSGIFLQLSTIPVYLSWLKYGSRFYYGMEAISILQWSQIDEIACSDNPNLPCVSTGEGVLVKYGYDRDNLYHDLGGLCIMFFVLHILGYIFLKRRCQKQATY